MNKPAEKSQPALPEPWDQGDAVVLQPDEGESYAVEKASGFGPKLGA